MSSPRWPGGVSSGSIGALDQIKVLFASEPIPLEKQVKHLTGGAGQPGWSYWEACVLWKNINKEVNTAAVEKPQQLPAGASPGGCSCSCLSLASRGRPRDSGFRNKEALTSVGILHWNNW